MTMHLRHISISPAWLVKELNEIDRLLLAQQKSINENFQEVKRLQTLVLEKLNDFGSDEFISEELEAALREVSKSARRIDEQVPDQGT